LTIVFFRFLFHSWLIDDIFIDKIVESSDEDLAVLVDLCHLLVHVVPVVTSVGEADSVPFHGIFLFTAKDAGSRDYVALATVLFSPDEVVFVEVSFENLDFVSEGGDFDDFFEVFFEFVVVLDRVELVSVVLEESKLPDVDFLV
jgi:hypothetical protein